MSEKIAPYLNDYTAQFRMDFVFFDSALTTSEIKPLHLSLPGNKRLTKKTLPRTAVPRSSMEVPANLVRQQTRTAQHVTRNMPEKLRSNTAPESEASPSKPARSTAAIPHHMASTQPMKKETQEYPKRNLSQTNFHSQNDIPQSDHDLTFDLSGFYLLPCQPSDSFKMRVEINNIEPNIIEYRLNMAKDIDPEVRVRVTVEGHSRSSPVKIFFADKEVGIFKYNANNKSYTIGLTGLDPALEAAAVLFNQSFSGSSMPRIFDFIIPALKKVNKRNHMYSMKFSEQSMLVQSVSRMAKESIRLKAKIPPSEGNGFDTRFGGEFQEESLYNFILYHESNPKREIASLSKITDNSYFLKVGYPLSPIQGFFAAVSVLIPL